MLLDLKTVARRLSVNYYTARKMVLAGAPRGRRVGVRIKVSEEDLAEYLINAEIHGPQSGPIEENRSPKAATIKRAIGDPKPYPKGWREQLTRE